MEQSFKYVHDRKSKPEIMTEDVWDAPINIEVWEHGQLFKTEILDEVEVIKDDGYVQLSWISSNE